MARAASHNNPLEERYSHDILIRLLECGSMMKTELLRSVSKSSCMIIRLEHLEEAGLVQTYNDTFSHNTKWVSLTAKGEEVARLLKIIGDIMDGIETTGGIPVVSRSNGWDTELVGSFSQDVESVERSRRKQTPPD